MADWIKDASPILQLVLGILALIPPYIGIAAILCWAPFSCLPDVKIDTASSNFNPAGYDRPADEYVCLVNEEDGSVTLTGWELRDAEGTVNVLPHFTLAGGTAVRVHPGRGSDTRTDLYGTEGNPVWTNGGDSVTLVNEHGETIDSRSYSSTDDGEGGSCGS